MAAIRFNTIPQIVKQDFINLTKEILDMRNDLYHHRPIQNRQKCVEACERLARSFRSPIWGRLIA
ncbi:hypothetical protein D9M68_151800 [compost metagenome]